MRSSDSYEPAAFHVEFRFWNKTGQKIYLEWNTSDIQIEDNNGNIYVDYYGNNLLSTQVAAGGEYGFYRYYTMKPNEKSRVPPGTSIVWVKVAKFSQIENATWRYDIYPISESISPPLTAIKTGDAFRQGDLELVVKDVYIRPSDDSNRWAVRVWYELRNVGSKRIVVDIDYAYLDVMDSSAPASWIGTAEAYILSA